MTHSDATENYNLPIYADEDRPTWRGDVNATNLAIDAALKGLSDSIPTGPGEPSDAAFAAYLARQGIVIVRNGGAGLTAKQLDEMSLFTEGV